VYGGLSVFSSTAATASITIGATAELGPRGISITTENGTSNTATFSVQTGLPPVLSSITPNFGPRRAIVNGGATTPVTLLGSGFTGGNIVLNTGGTGITHSTIVVANGGTSATTILVMASVTTVETREFSVTTSGGASGTVQFTVTEPLPILTSITPNFGSQNRTATVTFVGSNFDRGELFTVVVAGAGITVPAPGTVITVITSSIATATLAIDAAASLGARGVLIRTVGGQSAQVNFTIRPIAPQITVISANQGTAGALIPVTITGSTFLSGLNLQIANTGGLTSSIVGMTSTLLTRLSERSAISSPRCRLKTCRRSSPAK
jgi:hypothetical protein